MFQLHHFLPQLAALRFQQGGVDQHAGALHPEQHFARRQLDLQVYVFQPRVGLHLGIQALVQAQRHIGVLGRVLGGALHAHLFEADALRALAGDFVVADGGQVQMAFGERAQVVAQMRFEHVGLEQGVVRHAAKPNAVIGEHVLIVLEILAELRSVRILEPGPQQSERALHAELLRRAGIVVRERQIRRPPRLDAKGHAHQLRGQRVEAGGLGVERGQRGGSYHSQPLGHFLFVEYGVVMAFDRIGPAVGLPRCGLRGSGPRRRRILQPALEAEALEQLGDFGLAVRLRQQFLRFDRQRHLAVDRKEFFRLRQPRQRAAQVFKNRDLLPDLA